MLSSLYLPNINHVSLRLADIVQLQLFKTFPDQFMTNSSCSEVIWGGHLQNPFFLSIRLWGKGEGGRGEKGSFAILWNKKGSRLIVLPFPFLCIFLFHDSDMINFCCRTHSPEKSERLLLSKKATCLLKFLFSYDKLKPFSVKILITHDESLHNVTLFLICGDLFQILVYI